MAKTNRLHQELAERILHMLREQELGPGTLLNENSIARSLNVSRTPIRAAFAHLAERGIVQRHPNRGVEVLEVPVSIDPAPSRLDELDAAMVRIAHERQEHLLDDEVTEIELMRRYNFSRPEVHKLLARLAELDMVERKPGYGWRFVHGPRDPAAHLERYRFRMIIEPAAILEPDFALDRGWAADIRARHVEVLEAPWRDSGAVAFFEMNAEFHEGLAKASANRYLHAAVRRQNELRRLSNYDWTFGVQRVHVNCREHLQILDEIEAGDRAMAAMLMRRHLERASVLRGTRTEPQRD